MLIFPRCLSAVSEFDTGVKGGSPRTKNMMIDVVPRVLDAASFVRISCTIVQRGVKEVISKQQKLVTTSHVDICNIPCCDHWNVLESICQSTGLGKIRPIDVALLWLSGWFEKDASRWPKVAGRDNPADILAKYLPGVKISDISRRLGFFVESGRSNIVDTASVVASERSLLWNSGGSQQPVAGAAGECRQYDQ